MCYREDAMKRPTTDSSAEKQHETNLLSSMTLLTNEEGHPLTHNHNIEIKDPQQVVEDIKNNYPLSEQWRLFVDGIIYARSCTKNAQVASTNQIAADIKTNLGWYEYDCREPGSLQAVLFAFNFLLKHIKQPVSVPLILQFHRL